MAAKGTIKLQDLQGNPLSPNEIQSGDTIIAIVTPPEGYEYNRWVDNAGNTITEGIQQLNDTTFRITVECGVLYKVIFKKIGDDTCSIDTFIYLNNGVNETLCTTCGTIDVSEYYCNGQATIEALPNCCYEFVGWSDGNTENPRTVGVTMGSHLEYRAIVKPKLYKITPSSNDPYMGKLGIGPEDGSYIQGTPYYVRCDDKFMLKAITAEGGVFEGWNDLADSDANYKTNPRVVRFDCTLEYGSFNEGPLTDYIANFKAIEKYKIRYHSGTEGDEISNDTQSYAIGESFTTKPSNTFSYAYHTFTGWKFDSQTSGIYGGGVEISLTNNIAALADANNIIHMYAQWSEAEKRTVKYDINGGEGEIPEPQEGYVGSTIILNDGEGISKARARLIGWCTTSDGTGTVYDLRGNYTMTDEDIVLYACWSNLYVVRYSPNGGDGDTKVDNNGGDGYTENSIVTIWSNAVTGYTKANHTFMGWNTSSDGTGTSYNGGDTFSIQDNVRLYAMWLADESSTLQLYNADGTTMYSQYSGYVGNNVTLDYVPTATHQTFQGWAEQIGGSVAYNQGDSYTLVSGGSQLYAVWTAEQTYTVTYNGNGSTSGSVVDSNSYYSGDSATVLGSGNLVKSGSPYNCVFDGWYTNAQGTGTKYIANDTITITQNTILYAKWVCCPITFAVNSSAYGSINVNGTTVTSQGTFNFEDATQISITVTPATGYTFIGWVDNATNLYLISDDDECASPMTESTRYAYVPIATPTATGQTYPTVNFTEPEYIKLYEFENAPVVVNQIVNPNQYYQAIDLGLVGCPVDMACGGTYTAMFVPCEYGSLSLCSECEDGYEYVESDPIYVYERLDESLYPATPTNWRGENYVMPSPVTATSPMYFAYVVSYHPLVYEYYKKVYNNGAYSYVQLTGTDAETEYWAAPVAEQYSPDYIYDDIDYYYKITYDGTNVTNITKAYKTIPTEYLGDVIAWYDSNATYNGYYDYGILQSEYNLYYEWNTTTNGYTLIPTSHCYEHSSAWLQMNNIFLQTRYLNWTYIQINGGRDITSQMYKWNGSMYIETNETPSSYYAFGNVSEFTRSYLRYDSNNNAITSYIEVNEDGIHGNLLCMLKWDGVSYTRTCIIPVFNWDYNYDGYDATEYLNELNGLFPMTGNGLHVITSNTGTWLHHFGDIVNFNNNLYTWNNNTQSYSSASGIALSSAHAHIYGTTPTIGSGTPNEFIGTLILYNGALMKLKYCFNPMCDYNMYYEPTGYTIARNNIIGTTSAAVDGLYVTARSVDETHSPTAMSVSPSNYIDNTYGVPDQNDANYVLVVSVYYLGGKESGTDTVYYSLEYPCLSPNGNDSSSTDSGYSDYNDIPGWRARTGLTDGNPTENMYLFTGTIVSPYFIKHTEYNLFKKVCQTN